MLGARAGLSSFSSKVLEQKELDIYTSAHAKAARAFSNIDKFSNALALRRRAATRRFATWTALREKRGLTAKPAFAKRTKEELEEYLAIDHDESEFLSLSELGTIVHGNFSEYRSPMTQRNYVHPPSNAPG
ncbi:hypothetical protein F5X98DRAFT_379170 [Xylaria grammica]|nr:hypothetical protein F5X98DRAFT_379170 [Xylaria grammica]